MEIKTCLDASAGTLKVDHYLRIRKFRGMRRALEDALCKPVSVSLDGPEQVMIEVSLWVYVKVDLSGLNLQCKNAFLEQICKLMPYAEDLDRCMNPLGDMAGLVVTLALSQISTDMWGNGNMDESVAKWVLAKFIKEPFKYAQK